MRVLITFLCVISLSLGLHLPRNFKKCHSKDNNCLANAIEDAIKKMKNGNKNLEVPQLDPLQIPALNLDTKGEILDIKLNFVKVKLEGYYGIKVENVSLDLSKNSLKFYGSFPSLKCSGSYKMTGKVMDFDVNGSGYGASTLENVTSSYNFALEQITINRKTFLKNISNGNKELSEKINTAMNKNSKKVYADFNAVVEKGFGTLIALLANNLFSKVPLSEIFIE